eukprot:TRINITY_DN13201_c0_g1_i1.p1 TRINITY_DN13201_c0_g1~~TRINITY_DN13201_c0_g1_i1.p1  ORF type:complete len:1324 (+),score=235.45 TRINITY_DN13201_c0_g1_i1:56-4027(+)
MDVDEQYKSEVNIDEASWLSKVSLMWLRPLILGASKKAVNEEDVPSIPGSLRAAEVAEKVDAEWEKRKHDGKYALHKTLIAAFRSQLVTGITYSLIAGLAQAAGRPMVLKYLIEAADDNDDQMSIILIVTLAVLLLVEAVTLTRAKHILCDHLGAKWIAATCYMIQKKASNLSPGSCGYMSGTSLIGTDVMQRYEMLKMLCQLPIAVVTFVVGIVVLVATIGVHGLVGLVLVVGVLVVSVKIGVLTGHVEELCLEKSDTRLSIMARAIIGIKAIKYSAWEEFFEQEITSARNNECRELARHKTLHLASVQLGRATPIIAASASFIFLAGSGEEMRSSDIFAALNVFQSLRLSLILIPFMFSNGASLLASLSRIQKYLRLEEMQTPNQPTEPDISVLMESSSWAWPVMKMEDDEGEEVPVPNQVAVGVEMDAVFPSSSKLSQQPTLSDISLTVKKGEKVAIIGMVGCGKTTLVTALLGGVRQLSGSPLLVDLSNIGYIPQKAFIACGTIEENIVMGRPFDEELLKRSLVESNLSTDIARLEGGIKTELGERGITLSGGQQQRICIARALYGQPSLLIADDPLAAVDPIVGSQIFNNAFAKYPGTLIMCLNQLQYIPSFDKILFLADGKAEFFGTPLEFSELRKQGSSSLFGVVSGLIGNQPEDESGQQEVNIDGNAANGESTQLIHAETKKTGRVKFNVIKQYVKGMGYPMASAAFGLLFVAYMCMAFADYWLAHWVNESEDHYDKLDARNLSSPETYEDDFNNTRYALIYGSGSILFLIFLLSGGAVLAACFGQTGRELHQKCITRLLRAPVSWFESTPSGRLMSRFSTDLNMVDQMLALLVEAFVNFSITMFFIGAIICYIVPPMIAVLFASCFLYAWQINAIDRPNREIKRMANNSNSPLLTTLTEVSSLAGRDLIRCMGLLPAYARKFESHIDKVNTYNFVSSALLNAGVLMAYVTAFVISTSTATLMVVVGGVPASEMGLALTYCFMLPYFLQIYSAIVIMLITAFTSLERLLECSSEDIPQEPEWHTTVDTELCKNGWPSGGNIQFSDASLVYRPGLPAALSNVNLSLKGNTRIGIVGRTGAGKSSLLVLLFRLVDATEGTIMLDGIDLKKVGLQTVRRAMTIIPQEPLLMEGTIRYNLDPTGSESDRELEQSLVRVGLTKLTLDTEVGVGASGLSSGERQLVSLARTLVRKSKIIVLDEPTSNIDQASDQNIQKIMRSIGDTTIITIAHRLDTVIDSDLVVVMDAGHVAEVGHPADLLRNPDGYFSKMVSSTGPESASHLLQQAMLAKRGESPVPSPPPGSPPPPPQLNIPSLPLNL